MRLRRVLAVFALVALVAGAAPAKAALTSVIRTPATPVIDPAVTKQLATNSSADVVVGFRSKPTARDIAALRTAGFGGPFVTYDVVDAVAATATTASLRAIAGSARVSRVEFDAVLPYTLDRATTVGRAKHLWDAAYNVAGSLHTGGIQGRGVTVAVIDSGIDARHEDLRHTALANALGESPVTVANFSVLGRSSLVNPLGQVLVPEAFEDGTEASDTMAASATAAPVISSDNGGHGTHVAGIIAGRGRASSGRFKGVAPQAKLIGLSGGEALVVSRGLAALDWVHNNHAAYGIRIVNNSWGGAGDWDPNSLVTRAIRRLAVDDRVIMVFAAGNDGGDGTTINTSVWANIPEVISVGNYYDRTGWMSSTSSRGLKTLARTWPLVSAPGEQIISTAMLGGGVTYVGTAQDALISQLDGSGEPIVVPVPLHEAEVKKVNGQTVVVGDYNSMSGTSMATPFVAGVCALLLEANPALDAPTIKDILAKTANIPAGRTYATDGFEMGHGVVDATEAVAVALRLRDGAADVDAAIASASADYTASPVTINTGSGPVSDNSIPLSPVGGTVVPVTGSGHVYQGGLLDIFGLGGGERMLAGTPVQFAVRALHSNSSAIVLGTDTFEFTFTVLKGTTVVAGPFTGLNAFDDPDWQSSYDFDVPANWSGNYHMVGEFHYGPDIYRVFDLPIAVTKGV